MPRTPSVAEEIGQKTPFPSLEQEVLVTLLRTADEVRRYLTGILAEEDVTLQQFNVLRILRGAREEGLPTLEIGRRMVEQQPGVTRLVDRLIAKRLVTRERDTEDRRRVVCTIDPAGLELLGRVDRLLAERLAADLPPALPADRGAGLVEVLNDLRAGLRGG